MGSAERYETDNACRRILYVSQQFGHADVSITLQIYSHWVPQEEEERRIANILDVPAIRATKKSTAKPTAAPKKKGGEVLVSC